MVRKGLLNEIRFDIVSIVDYRYLPARKETEQPGHQCSAGMGDLDEIDLFVPDDPCRLTDEIGIDVPEYG